MESAIRRFLEYLERDRKSSENTILAYRADINQYRVLLDEKLGRTCHPRDISEENLDIYVTWLDEKGFRPATVSRKIAALRSYIDYLVRFEQFTATDLVTHLKAEPTPRRRPRVLEREEMERLMAGPAQVKTPRGLRDAAILSLLYATGLRAAELVMLSMDQLDVDRSMLLLSGGMKLMDISDAMPMITAYMQDGRPHLARYPEENAVFLNQRGRKLSRQGLWLIVKRWAQVAGLGTDVSPHTLRHSLAHRLIKEGRTRREIQNLLGLSSPNSIRVLGQIDD